MGKLLNEISEALQAGDLHTVQTKVKERQMPIQGMLCIIQLPEKGKLYGRSFK
ncbi:MAG: hypothetical protein ACLFPF_09850 [Halanaerobiales bacterium]